MRTLLRVFAAGVLTVSALSTANATNPPTATCRIACYGPDGSTAWVDVPGVTWQDCCEGGINFRRYCPVPGSTSYGGGWNHVLCPPF